MAAPTVTSAVWLLGISNFCLCGLYYDFYKAYFLKRKLAQFDFFSIDIYDSFCRMGIEVTFVDATDVKNVADALKDNTKMVWIETPTNPTLKLVDIAAVAALVKPRENTFLVVDNTFMSAYFQRPILFGADLVLHSCTKYMNGHTDVIMGAVCTNRYFYICL